MNKLTKIFLPAILALAFITPMQGVAQHRGSSRPTQTSRSSAARPGNSISSSHGNTRPTTTTTARPSSGNYTRPSATTHRPASTRPSSSNTRPNSTVTRPTNNHVNNTVTKPNNVTRPNTNTTRPGNNHGTRPGNNHATRPGGNVKPGGHHTASSAHKPGGWNGVARPHYNYRNPGYRPPRPGGGYWGAPRPNPYRIRYWTPPMPRYVRVLPSVPSIGTILGLTFGSFIDAGIASLYNAGYNVAGYYDNAIYLTNVRQLGYLWPEVMMQYNDGLLSGSQFYSWSAVPSQVMYDNLYRQLTTLYGAPVEVNLTGAVNTATWWGGGNTGYVTLSYGYGNSAAGSGNYYTSLTYTAY